jgi:hypothetical protein
MQGRDKSGQGSSTDKIGYSMLLLLKLCVESLIELLASFIKFFLVCFLLQVLEDLFLQVSTLSETPGGRKRYIFFGSRSHGSLLQSIEDAGGKRSAKITALDFAPCRLDVEARKLEARSLEIGPEQHCLRPSRKLFPFSRPGRSLTLYRRAASLQLIASKSSC